ncbi:hypothetical protein CA85_36570 [Allorhodopirellula solitaria]|uniref:Uncharacterized protein n=1 Tax=Allorhodopirellula solitaria TaxID=2527987 RepID=A0A5C5XT34_9BACT|nr:hypothetical protein CA85_36570 [Allorhodopirellula solitaria]
MAAESTSCQLSRVQQVPLGSTCLADVSAHLSYFGSPPTISAWEEEWEPLVGCQQFTGAAAEVIAAMRSMAAHRVDTFRTSRHSAEQTPKVAHQLTPSRPVQSQTNQYRWDTRWSAATLTGRGLPGRPVQQFK